MMLNRKMFTHITKTFLMPHRCQFVAGKVPVKRPKPLRNPPTKKDDLDYTKLSEEQKKVIRDT